jgi:uncharacterized protein (TIGR02118 family)
MAKVVVLYKNPKNTEAFDRHYSSVHIPLAKKIPGLKNYDIRRGRNPRRTERNSSCGYALF